jgi:hypothetical protein
MDVERSQPREGPGRDGQTVKPKDLRSERSPSPAPGDTAPHPAEAGSWELLMARGNLAEALRRVEQNAGAPGIDGMSTRELRPWLKDHWPEVRSQLDAGTYRAPGRAQAHGSWQPTVAHGRTTKPSITPSVSFDTTAGTRQGTNGYPSARARPRSAGAAGAATVSSPDVGRLVWAARVI